MHTENSVGKDHRLYTYLLCHTTYASVALQNYWSALDQWYCIVFWQVQLSNIFTKFQNPLIKFSVLPQWRRWTDPDCRQNSSLAICFAVNFLAAPSVSFGSTDLKIYPRALRFPVISKLITWKLLPLLFYSSRYVFTWLLHTGRRVEMLCSKFVFSSRHIWSHYEVRMTVPDYLMTSVFFCLEFCL